MPLEPKLRLIVFAVGLLAAASSRAETKAAAGADDEAEQTVITSETRQLGTRLRTSLDFYSFTINQVVVTGQGPEFSFESAVSPRWNISGSIGQVYTSSGSIQTLFTSIEGALWFSLWGSFSRQSSQWRSHGDTVVNYQSAPEAGLRVGLGLQQYFFNTSKGAIPFSGVAVKAMYELGLSPSFDIGAGVETARLSNPSSKAQAVTGFISLIWPLLGS